MALIQTFDVGIMPLSDSPWARGKCGYKLIQYMACGKPVVASPVGVNTEIVSSSVGLLAHTGEDWVQAISAMADRPDLRAARGAAARAAVEQNYCLQVVAPKIAHLLEDAARSKR